MCLVTRKNVLATVIDSHHKNACLIATYRLLSREKNALATETLVMCKYLSHRTKLQTFRKKNEDVYLYKSIYIIGLFFLILRVCDLVPVISATDSCHENSLHPINNLSVKQGQVFLG